MQERAAGTTEHWAREDGMGERLELQSRFFHTQVVCLQCLLTGYVSHLSTQSHVLPNVKDVYDGDLSPFGFNYS